MLKWKKSKKCKISTFTLRRENLMSQCHHEPTSQCASQDVATWPGLQVRKHQHVATWCPNVATCPQPSLKNNLLMSPCEGYLYEEHFRVLKEEVWFSKERQRELNKPLGFPTLGQGSLRMKIKGGEDYLMFSCSYLVVFLNLMFYFLFLGF